MRSDLHIHSHYSDGLMSPAIIVNSAKNCGVELVSLTDHDNVFGAEESEELCKQCNLKSVVGIEVSAYLSNVKIHTLGYAFDLQNVDFRNFLHELYSASVFRAEDILSKLKKVGIRLSLEEIYSQLANPHIPVHAMHIARAAVKKGYGVNEYQFYLEHLALGCDCHSNIERPTPQKTCEIIKAAGGITSLAHPGRIEMDTAELVELIKGLKGAGLDCIESVYSGHTMEQTEYFNGLAERFDLIVTGGSDTHTATGRRRIGQPKFYADDKLLQLLKIGN